MNIYPAIDLKGGQCVRLFKGDMAQATVFNDSPAAQAKEFEDAGFKYLHVVDLDGAIAGRAVNEEAVKEILAAVKMPVQLGGGIRDLARIEKWLDLGISRVILGTVAAKNPQIVKEACREFSGKIVVGIDSKDGFVATEGWVEGSSLKTLDLAKKYEDCGVEAVIYTDISRDGTLTGVDLVGTQELVHNLEVKVIASGGVAGLEDVEALRGLVDEGLDGVIVGKALYEGRVSACDLL